MTAVKLLATSTLALLACAACASTPTARATAASASGARPQPVRLEPLRGPDCLDPDFARSWTDLDERHLLVDAGRLKYLIELPANCSPVHWSPFLLLRGAPISGRVCGSLGDAVITREHTCRIESMRLVDEVEYKALLESRTKAGRRGRVEGT